ncbi:universal stress protein [Halomicroarcula limicola]|uniref:Universal stress protein n=1 Tax=Haloarcula limicola TaxID=1429915 RepID=A0A8J7Y7P5_9EURY|nr:universal stress protein [Halomicroarcula limicola]MBV0926105.1 universal stress protein [Halomicroarcula limicola]
MALERILLSVGPDDWDSLDGLVDAAADIAEPAGATVYVLYVFPRDEYDDLLDQMGVDQTSGGLSPDEVAERHDSVRVPADRFEDRGIDFEIRGVAGGQPSDQVVRKVDEFDADVVVVSGTKRSPAGKAMFGDHAQQVLLNAPVPVLYVKQE